MANSTHVRVQSFTFCNSMQSIELLHSLTPRELYWLMVMTEPDYAALWPGFLGNSPKNKFASTTMKTVSFLMTSSPFLSHCSAFASHLFL